MKRLFVLFLFLIPILLRATTYFVAPPTATPSGNDENVGTITAPWGTW
jgi:hypothetical protein